MRKVLRMMRVGHIEDGSAVCLLCTGKGLQGFGHGIGAAMVADLGDPAPELLVNDRLISAASLQVVIADQAHVLGLRRVLSQGCGSCETEC